MPPNKNSYEKVAVEPLKALTFAQLASQTGKMTGGSDDSECIKQALTLSKGYEIIALHPNVSKACIKSILQNQNFDF